ncbi:hypothetical protein GF312_22690 [Candidatus Poribacteria bacterium]|nr:hypothetical protein [Candidatus Poribacteria bacterium]
MKFMVVILILLGLASKAYCQDTKVIEGPVVLYSNIADQWGGHTFCYLLEGEKAVFWSATERRDDGKLLTALIGQHPKTGSGQEDALTKIPFEKPGLMGINQPQMVRSSDGYIHIFIGITYEGKPGYNPGKIRYYRTKNPEDISELVDRTELIPAESIYKDFHLRMNVGISPDGQRMVLVILAISDDGSVPFNTPVIFFGEKDGVDFTFKKPVKYSEAMSFFYPQVAATDDGIVLIGELWDNQDRTLTRLIHLDWSGKIIHQEDLPAEKDGRYMSFDLRPLDRNDWSKLGLYYNKQPKASKTGGHEFWEYDVKNHQLRLLNSVEDSISFLNAGKWFGAKFINNPSMGKLYVWEGDIAGGGEITKHPLPGANMIKRGYQASAYMFAANMLQGSIKSEDGFYIASDCFNPCRKPKTSGPSSFLMWRISR